MYYISEIGSRLAEHFQNETDEILCIGIMTTWNDEQNEKFIALGQARGVNVLEEDNGLIEMCIARGDDYPNAVLIEERFWNDEELIDFITPFIGGDGFDEGEE